MLSCQSKPHWSPPPVPSTAVNSKSSTNHKQRHRSSSSNQNQPPLPALPTSSKSSGGKENLMNVVDDTMTTSDQSMSSQDAEIDRYYEEIDQIYDYVRGFAPLPESVKKELAAARLKSQTTVDLSFVQHRRMSYPTIVHDISASNHPSGGGGGGSKQPHHRHHHIPPGHQQQHHDRIQPPAAKCSFWRKATGHPPGVGGSSRTPIRSNSTGKLGLGSLGHMQASLGGHHHSGHHQLIHREPLLPAVQLTTAALVPPKPKLFVKSAHPGHSSKHHSRLLKYARAPTVADVAAAIVCPKLLEVKQSPVLVDLSAANGGTTSGTCRSNRSLSNGSPLFNIRYKSLNNLHILASGGGGIPSPPTSSPPPLMPLSPATSGDGWGSRRQAPIKTTTDTLDSAGSAGSSGRGGQQSSTSAATTSSGSGASKEQPTKSKTRKLSRPKSLTNLFWDMAAAVTGADRHHHHHHPQHGSDKTGSSKSGSPVRRSASTDTDKSRTSTSGTVDSSGVSPDISRSPSGRDSVATRSPSTGPVVPAAVVPVNRLCKSSSMAAVVGPRKVGTLYL